MLHHVEGGRISAKGCFQDVRKNRALPELLHIFRGDELDWRDLSSTVINKCQELAEGKNYKCFGIQFYGECWSGEDACNNYKIHGRADNCLCSGSDYIPYDHTKPWECVEPVGGEFSNFVYEIKLKTIPARLYLLCMDAGDRINEVSSMHYVSVCCNIFIRRAMPLYAAQSSVLTSVPGRMHLDIMGSSVAMSRLSTTWKYPLAGLNSVAGTIPNTQASLALLPRLY